ncbi:MAG: hypothetical protein R3C56_00765 [Pirellulaceae bacterium]
MLLFVAEHEGADGGVGLECQQHDVVHQSNAVISLGLLVVGALVGNLKGSGSVMRSMVARDIADAGEVLVELSRSW